MRNGTNRFDPILFTNCTIHTGVLVKPSISLTDNRMVRKNFLFQAGFDLFDSDGDGDDDATTLSPAELQSLTSTLNRTLFHLLEFLNHFSLKRSRESLEVTVQELVDLTHLETNFPNLDFDKRNSRNRSDTR